ncbi:hypothetical protein [Glaciimonas sp. PCH181]|uniref:DoxX family protein n=1 Tax=Glaciimonas sp. PCH181 TaxID=2133943 RepID=UPI000D38C90B|nr:hypothetical protein [Glaciimonas sp. PCH181]PUA19033.1 hypothetical protein C7W93_03760 [Glaciimonas sp. PCH181]
MMIKKCGISVVFIWFLIGGIGHFVAPDFFLQIIPPNLPFRLQAVYISGFFEIAGACGLIAMRSRRAAGIGLFLLTIAVTPANVYMWQNSQLFPSVSPTLLALRLPLQLILLALIWWSTKTERHYSYNKNHQSR